MPDGEDIFRGVDRPEPARRGSAPDRLDLIGEAWRRERPDLDLQPQQVIGRLHRVARHLTEELATVYERHGLTEGEFDVLATLRRAGAPYERSPGDLALHTLVTSGGMTKRIDRLEQAGLVTRRVSDSDARARVVALTDRGCEVIDAAFTDHMANERRLLDLIAPGQARALEDALRTWLAALEEPPATA